MMYCPADLDPESSSWADPHAVFAGLRDQDDGVHYLPHLGYWLVTRHAHVREVLSNPDVYSARNAQIPLRRLDPAAARRLPHPVPVLSDVDPPEHTRLRRALAPQFSRRAVERMIPEIRGIADTCARAIAGRTSPVDLAASYTTAVPGHTMLSLLGFPVQQHREIFGWCAHKLALTWGVPEDEHAAAEGMSAFWHACVDLIASRLVSRRDDLTSRLLDQRDSAVDGDRLSLPEITSMLYALAFAGWETTSGLLAHTVQALLDHELVPDELSDDELDQVIVEVLRLDSSVLAWRRRTTQPVVLGGVEIPSQADLLVGLASANTDPAAWGLDSAAFRPGRADAHQHLSFGGTTHYCLGHTLARVETRIAIRTLFQHAPNLALVEEQQPEYLANLAFRRPTALWAWVR